jgi:hypothetical protein
VIDLAELNRRYLKAGSVPYLTGMQSFIEAGRRGSRVGEKAAKYVSDKDEDGKKKLRRGGALWRLNQVKIISPYSHAAKERRPARRQL